MNKRRKLEEFVESNEGMDDFISELATLEFIEVISGFLEDREIYYLLNEALSTAHEMLDDKTNTYDHLRTKQISYNLK